jgi:glycosyltransferase involved in cell wall biosynthesis
VPVISLCVIVYNLEKYIGVCLDSILNQGFQDYELIVVDNGSNDNSIAICEEYARNYKEKIRYFKLPLPSIPARGHSFAVEQAIGEYVHVIDGDDCVAENYLNEVHKVIIEQQPDLIMGRFECIVEEGASNYLDVDIDAKMINGKEVNEAIEYIFDLPYFNRYVWRFITKRSLLSFSKFEDSVSHLVIADNIKATVWLMRAKSIYFIEKPFYYYRRRLGSTVSSVNNKMTLDYIKGIFEISKIISAFEMPIQIEYLAHLQSKQMLWYLKLFYSGYRYLEASDIILLAEYIEENRSLWRF